MVAQHNNQALEVVLNELTEATRNLEYITPIVTAFNYTLGSVAKVLVNAYITGAEVCLAVRRTNARIAIQEKVIKRHSEFAQRLAPAHALIAAYHDYITQIKAQFEDDPEAVEIAKLLAQKVLVDALDKEGYPVLMAGNEVKLLLADG